MATAIDSTPVVAHGAVYIESFSGLFALNATTGQPLWNTSAVRGLGSPALHNDNLTVGGVDGNLSYISGADGRILWHLHLVDHGRYKGLSSSPKVVGGRAYLGTYDEGGGAGEVVSVNLFNGTIAWRVPARGGSIDLSSPAVVNGTVYIGVSGLLTPQLTLNPPHGLLALNASDGRERWFHQTASAVVSSPVVAGDRVYFTEKAGALVALSTTGQERWRRDISGDGTSSPSMAKGRLFVASGTFDGTGFVRAYDLSGTELWTFSGANGGIQASPTFSQGLLYLSTNARAGTIYALWADNGTIAWAYTPSPHEYLFSSPVVAEGRLYQGSDAGFLFALGDGAQNVGNPPPPGPNLNIILAVGLIGAGVIVAAVAYLVLGRRGPHG
jgi:outer membrane protein assembly factor BamB